MERQQILIVDDYAGSRYQRSRILSEAGYEVLEAASGEEALRIVASTHPALVLLDVNLPDISGTEVCERIKRNGDTADIRVIQITGAWLSEADRAHGLASGADDYLTEPVEEVALLRSVVNVMETKT
jgi:CheY-like chemotaxis protein